MCFASEENIYNIFVTKVLIGSIDTIKDTALMMYSCFIIASVIMKTSKMFIVVRRLHSEFE